MEEAHIVFRWELRGLVSEVPVLGVDGADPAARGEVELDARSDLP